ncbi:MAG: ACT domain-containing protein [Elusimicrobiota bacterium]|nr:ACT domain-containing protein [Elusimicrobiota bacterium]
MRVEKLKQFSIFMPNRPGALARLAELFSTERINILGIASEVRDDSGLVRIALPADADVSSVLSKAGFSSVETHILSVEVDDSPGELFRVTEALATAKINITTVYGTAVDGARTARILVAVQNADKALEVLQSLAQARA